MNVQKNSSIYTKKSTGIFLRSFLEQKFVISIRSWRVWAYFVSWKIF